VPDAGGELTVPLRAATRGRWLVVWLSVGADVVLEMLPNPLAAQSVITNEARDDLNRWGMLSVPTARRQHLHDLKIEGQPVPDLDVIVTSRIQQLRVDGILGRDFFAQFADVRWDVRGNRLTLIYP
jgi:hypothetical protein